LSSDFTGVSSRLILFEDTFVDTPKPDALSPIMEMTVQLVSAYVQKNAVSLNDFPDLIDTVHAKLNALNRSAAEEPVAVLEKLQPAVPIKKSVTPDYLISLEDGKRYKSLKRHLGKRGLSPDEYRVKWGLAADYPMVAANYSTARSALAKKMGLGRRSKPEADTAPKPKRSRKQTT
jgi:predicted transcriptional regulator